MDEMNAAQPREPIERIAMRKGMVGKRRYIDTDTKKVVETDEPLVFGVVDCAQYEEPMSKMGYAMGPRHGGPKDAWAFNAMKAHEQWAVGAELTEAEFDAVAEQVLHKNAFR